jgi:hypothetical protein
MIAPDDIYTKNGKDFRVHFVKNGEAYGVLYYSKDRGNLRAESCEFEFRRIRLDWLLDEGAELIQPRGLVQEKLSNGKR